MSESAHNELRDRIVKQAFQCREALEVYAFSLLRDRTEAEDVVQDAFLVVMEKFEAFEEGSSMMAWTRAIVRRKVLQALDRRNRRANVMDHLLYDTIDAAFEEVDSEAQADQVRARRRRLDVCLERIGSRPRQLLDRVYACRMSYEATSESMNMNVEAVRKSLYRAKRQLRECLKRTPTEASA